MTANTLPSWPDDETLLAFADGKLDAEAAAHIESAMDRDPDLKRLVTNMRTSGALAAIAFDDAMKAPARDSLVDMILTAPAAQSRDAPSNVLKVAKATPSRFQSRFDVAALAACLTLAIGGVLGYQFAMQAVNDRAAPYSIAVGPVMSGSAVSNLLDTRRSGDPLTLTQSSPSDKTEALIIASFRDRDGRVCRELETIHVQPSGSYVINSVACRESKGGWTIIGAAQNGSGTTAPDQQFSPAAGTAHPALDGILKSIGATPALAPADEAALIERLWK